MEGVEGRLRIQALHPTLFHASSDPQLPMKLFACQACGQPFYFENTRCESCGRTLGFQADEMEVIALEPAGGEAWRSFVSGPPVRFCANAAYDACNWLIPAAQASSYCTACRHNRTVPDLSVPENLRRWRKLEAAKRRLFYTLLRLRLPVSERPADPEGLSFDFLADPSEMTGEGPSILTGHDRGLITINIAEADDAARERMRHDMGEPYRTLLGHFRHEVGHYYWNVLIRDDPSLERFRAVFGDERENYGEALKRHYAAGPPHDWQDAFVSAYAAAHPWEDFAETWAHYLHIVDTLETAGAFGLRVQPVIPAAEDLSARIDFDPHDEPDLDRLIRAWLPLTFAVNSLNRSMGQPDLYPFVLSPVVVGKLGFIHGRIYEATRGKAPDGALAAVIGRLRSPIGSPGL